jgi:hypothetical protein
LAARSFCSAVMLPGRAWLPTCSVPAAITPVTAGMNSFAAWKLPLGALTVLCLLLPALTAQVHQDGRETNRAHPGRTFTLLHAASRSLGLCGAQLTDLPAALLEIMAEVPSCTLRASGMRRGCRDLPPCHSCVSWGGRGGNSTHLPEIRSGHTILAAV